LIELIEQLRPRAVLLLNDLWTINRYLTALERYRSEVAVIAYCPVDNYISNAASLAGIQNLTHLVLYTHFAEGVIRSCIDELRAKLPFFKTPDITVVPHGTSIDLFNPVQNDHINLDARQRRRSVRRLLLEESDLGDSAFIVLNANRNQPRKRIDISLKGFALFARDKPKNVRLWLHMGTKDFGWDIPRLSHRLGIEDRILMTTTSKDHPFVAEERLNLIYNSCDVGLNTSCGEGWGLASFEHAATGAAQVVPRHSSCEELWTGSAVMVEPSQTSRMGLNLQASIVSPEAVAEALEKLYADREYLDEMSRAAFHNATRPDYRWQNIAETWVHLLDRL
jgi:D-inositol-3-phosphate glycosyltransferase